MCVPLLTKAVGGRTWVDYEHELLSLKETPRIHRNESSPSIFPRNGPLSPAVLLRALVVMSVRPLTILHIIYSFCAFVGSQFPLPTKTNPRKSRNLYQVMAPGMKGL